MIEILNIEKKYLKKEIPEFQPGDVVKIHINVSTGKGTRIQVFQGIVIRIKGSGINRTYTVRKISYGIGVEKIFPINSPVIEKIELVSKGKTRRAKLYYLRERTGKKAKVKRKETTKNVKNKNAV
ncbi:MAG: 50S ribosomal protein L19 [Actinobacteria bacterium]|nr:50S ribosomal protein L19 [Actinomycetota bacterium]